MAEQITDDDVRKFAEAIDAVWSYCNAITSAGVDDKNFQKLKEMFTKAQDASNLLTTACQQRKIYENLDQQIKENAADDPFMAETLKRQAIWQVQYTTTRVAVVLYELSVMMKE
jgi:hypothetical protein